VGGMMNLRGVAVLVTLVAVAAMAGFSAGGIATGKKWSDWTYSHVAASGKGDRR
jgi:hypothetical protein